MPESEQRKAASKNHTRYKILIADDSAMNRALLSAMLEDEYDITEVENGAQAVSVLQERASEFALVLLDIVMPEMDGFEVLMYMNKYHWIDDLPVIMISSETAPQFIRRAYEFNANDYISRPFDAAVVQKRVKNTLMLYAKQRRLAGLVADQIFEKKRTSNIMVAILSHIVEFRNGESGLHVLHISAITELLLKRLRFKTDRYPLTDEEIDLISTASALHDIGKISIPSEVLNKPGRLTPEEFAIMKTHSAVGGEMLDQLPIYRDEPLLKYAYQICRWHHERYDGRGYPDGLVGDDIPISAQIVALADVYDALTSDRCYKKAFSHEQSIAMITQGECGTFNPLLLELLQDAADDVREAVSHSSFSAPVRAEVSVVTEKLLEEERLTNPERVARLLSTERTKFQFLSSVTEHIVFMYTSSPSMLTLNPRGAARLGIPETTLDPSAKLQPANAQCQSTLDRMLQETRSATPEEPNREFDVDMCVDGQSKPFHCQLRAIYLDGEEPEYVGVVGVLIDKDEA